ncbi:MAG: SIS domain-containing protein [Chloroflexi bacterium]|nr:SIS domain-containing protein [Chloroflexota bacterium]
MTLVYLQPQPSDADDRRSRFARDYVARLAAALNDMPFERIAQCWEMLESAYAGRKQVFLAGNGGSAATASHMANDLLKGIAHSGLPGMRAIALTDNIALITAIANDLSYDEVFAQQLIALGEPGDLLIVISGSGNSPNIVRAVQEAKRLGIATIGFLGMGGGPVGRMVDCPVVVPSDDYGPIEDAHMMLDHVTLAYFRGWLAERRRAEA